MMRDASYADIGINAIVKFLKDMNNGVPNFIDLIALPWNRKQCLTPFPLRQPRQERV